VLFVVKHKSLRRADHSSRAVLPSMECLSVIAKLRYWEDLADWGCCAIKNSCLFIYLFGWLVGFLVSLFVGWLFG